MGYKLTESAIEKLKKTFSSYAINKINRELARLEYTVPLGPAQVEVDVNCDDYESVISKAVFVFAIPDEAQPIYPLEHNKWINIKEINQHVVDENVIFKDKSGELTLRNVARIDSTDNTVLCNIDDTWYNLDNMTHFMIFDK